MKHLAAYLLLGLGGNTSPSADDIKGVLDSVGIEADDDRLEKLLSELEGKDLQQVGAAFPDDGGTRPAHVDNSQLISEGSSKLASVPSGGGGGGGAAASSGGAAAAGGAPAEEEKKEDKKEEKEEVRAYHVADEHHSHSVYYRSPMRTWASVSLIKLCFISYIAQLKRTRMLSIKSGSRAYPLIAEHVTW